MIEDIVSFLTGIGLSVRYGAIDHSTFLPGIEIEAGGLVIDRERLLFPGDILHEAGHLAVMDSARRGAASGDAGADAGEEMGAIAWSYAAALHMGIDPQIVFHADGYKGGAASILENFAEGRTIGVPILEWKGLTRYQRNAEHEVPRYPHMQRWLCE